MLTLLTPAHAGQLFAKAGQSVVEMNLIMGFINSGRVKLILEMTGDDAEVERFDAHFEPYLNTGKLSYHRINEVSLEELANRADGVFVHGIQPLLTKVHVKGLVNKLPLFVHLHSLEMSYYHRLGFRLPWMNWDRSQSVYYIAPSEITRNRINSLAYEPVDTEAIFPPAVVIPHGNDLTSFSVDAGESLRKSLDIAPQATVILSFNRIDLQKFDYVQLLVIFHKLCKKHPDEPLVLLIAGSVSYEEQHNVDSLENMCAALGLANRVRFYTDVDEAEKPAVFAAADLYLSLACNPQESFGIALLEAMAAGLPVVATAWNGYAEVLGEGYKDCLIPTLSSHEVAWKKDAQENLQGLSQASAPLTDVAVSLISELVTNLDQRQKLAAYGKQRAAEFSWDRTVNQLIDLWEQAINETASGEVIVQDTEGLVPVKSPVDGLATYYLGLDTRLQRCTDWTAQEIDKVLETTVITEGERAYLPMLYGILERLDYKALTLGELYIPGMNDYPLFFQIVLSMIRRGLINFKH